MNIVVVRSGQTINEATQAINNTCGATIASPRPDYDGALKVEDILSVNGPTIVANRYVFVVVCLAKKVGLDWFQEATEEMELEAPSWATNGEASKRKV